MESNNGKAPFQVVAINDLMDQNRRLQGERGYSNPRVRPGDELTHISSIPLKDCTLASLHALLRGTRGSAVELAFTRSDGAESHSFLVQAVRHGAHEFAHESGSLSAVSTSQSSTPTRRMWEREIQQHAEASVMSSPSPSARAGPGSSHSGSLSPCRTPSYESKPRSASPALSPPHELPSSEVLSDVLSQILGPSGSRATSGESCD